VSQCLAYFFTTHKERCGDPASVTGHDAIGEMPERDTFPIFSVKLCPLENEKDDLSLELIEIWP
jgi:hypothetical protein